MDMVIKKKTDVLIPKNFGRIFKKYNMMKYISPDDKSDISVFAEVCAETFIYIFSKEKVIKFEDITLSIFRDTFPRKMVSALKKLGFFLKRKSDGIYYVYGELPFSVQIVVGRELPLDENPWLKLLTRHAGKELVYRALNEYIKLDEINREKVKMILLTCAKANKKVFLEVEKELDEEAARTDGGITHTDWFLLEQRNIIKEFIEEI